MRSNELIRKQARGIIWIMKSAMDATPALTWTSCSVRPSPSAQEMRAISKPVSRRKVYACKTFRYSPKVASSRS
jgi:hypothetical protein